MTKKVGIMSGSFDPVHNGHAMMASYALQYCGFDEVWLLPSRRNPLKEHAVIASDADRYAMLQIVADRVDGLRADDIEFGLPEPSYTYRTLQALSERHPDYEFTQIIGADNWACFDRWRNSDRIIREYGLLIFVRPGYDTPAGLPLNVRVAEGAPQVLISSTWVREGLAKGRDMNFFLPEGVVEYIKKRKLYE